MIASVFFLSGQNINLLAPVLDESRKSSSELISALSSVAYTVSQRDFAQEFSISLSFWLDSFPLMPKTIMSVRLPRKEKETIVTAILVGAAFVEIRFVEMRLMVKLSPQYQY